MTLPSIRVNVKASFPALVTGTGVLSITKANGVWSFGMDYRVVVTRPAALLDANALVAVQDQSSGIFYSQTLSTLIAEAVATPNRVVTTTGAVAAASSDGDILLNPGTPASITVTLLPCAQAIGPIGVKDIQGFASSFNVTILATGSETIDGQSSAALTSDWASLTFYPMATGGYYIK